jgi:hypothetical protein
MTGGSGSRMFKDHQQTSRQKLMAKVNS